MARLWLQRPTRRDWYADLIGAVIIGISAPRSRWWSAPCLCRSMRPTIPPLQPITTEGLWIAGLWLFYWPLKILGEELACLVCCCRAWSCGLGDMRGP
jgi:hypothetical protein